MGLPVRKMGRLLKIGGILLLFISIILVFSSFIRGKPVLDMKVLDFRYKLGHVYFNQKTLTFSDDGDQTSYLSVTFTPDIEDAPDMSCSSKDKNGLCMKWMHRGKLEITETVTENTRCYDTVWTPKNNGFLPVDCVSLGDAHWYGGSAHSKQMWPVEKLNIPMQPYVTSPLKSARENGHEIFGPVLERYWFNSKGVGIFIDNTVPLLVSVNRSHLCFKASYDWPSPYQNEENVPPILRYFVCKSNNARDIHEYMYKKCFHVPSGIPDESRMKYPMWTSARYHNNSVQFNVLEYTNTIAKLQFHKGFFEIYGQYFRGYGDYNFDDNKFHNAHQMISEMKFSGFEIGTWVAPFMHLNTINFEEGRKNKFFILTGDAQLPASISWNGNVSVFVDFTNEKAVEWFRTILENIKKDYMITAFVFNGGEASFYDRSTVAKSFIHNPCEYTTKYVEFAHSFGNKGTVKVGYQSQRYPLFIEISDRESSWDFNGGLKSLIPTVLTYGLLGYPFINPGPIGGRADFQKKPVVNNEFTEKIIPNSELYVRWMLLATYLPIMQFSVPPWDYDDNVTKLAREVLQTHENKIFPILITAAREALITGMPIIRPVWWVAPGDETAQRIDCEFLVGDDLLVAPVLDKGARSRNVYLPSGSRWKANLRPANHDGGQWLSNYQVGLMEIATFDRVKSP